jgi:hypothetical protein
VITPIGFLILSVSLIIEKFDHIEISWIKRVKKWFLGDF